MRIHCIFLVKNEIDIAVECLNAALEWCDYIYVFDNGSIDGTWEAVSRLSETSKKIILYTYDDCPFADGLRGQVFNHYCVGSEIGDWWCALDADEFYIDDPRMFLQKIPRRYSAVSAASFQYYFTDKDLERYTRDPSAYADSVPVNMKCRYYINNWGEIRFVRHTKNMVWKSDTCWPASVGRYYPVRIRLQHFQYRSPGQIQKRLDTRREAIAQGKFSHERIDGWSDYVTRDGRNKPRRIEAEDTFHWRSRIVSADRLYFDAHDKQFVCREDLMPGLPTGLCSNTVKKAYRIVKDAMRALMRRS